MIDPGSALAAVKQFRNIRDELAKHTPDAGRKKAYQELLDEVLLENNALIRALPETLYQAAVQAVHQLFPQWEGDPEHFSPHDIIDALRELFAEGVRAGTNKKREILERAFFSRFRPDFYKSGESRLLWDLVKQLEYPQVWALRELINQHQKAMAERQRISLSGGLNYQDGTLFLRDEDRAISYTGLFVRLGLIREVRVASNSIQMVLLPQAFRLREFIWAEEWPEEK